MRAPQPGPPAAFGARKRVARLLCAALVGFALGGCGPKDPLESKVDAADYPGFTMWRSRAAGRLTPEQLGDFDHAVQAIKFHIMSTGQASGSEAIDQAMLVIVDGKTVREVFRTGLGWELKIAEDERATLEDSLRKNALMTTRPGDTASSNYLSDLRERQTARFDAATAEVARIRSRLVAAGLPNNPPGQVPQPDR